MRPEQAQGYVCPAKAAQYLRNRSDVTKRFSLLFRQCGIRTADGGQPGAKAVCKVGFHSLRHTWVTRAAEDGVDSATIREVAGWGSPAMERIYTHLSPEHVRSQMLKRKSTAFGETAHAAPEADGPDDLASLDSESLRSLLRRARDELSSRGRKKC